MGSGEELIINLLFALVFGGICAAVASSKGRNVVGWFFIGFFFSCLGLIIILCLSNLNEEQAKWDANQVEQRRLREQLRQEQLKNEALRQSTTARLDRHDEALGIDTREGGKRISSSAGEGGKASRLLTGDSPPPSSPPEGFPDHEWYFAEGGQERGPFRWQEISQQAQAGRVKAETLVWVSGMPDWQPAREIPNLIRS